MSKARALIAVLAAGIAFAAYQLLPCNRNILFLFNLGVVVVVVGGAILCVRSAHVRRLLTSSQKDGTQSPKLAITRSIGAFVSLFYPKYGQCYRCRLPWAVRRPHVLYLEGIPDVTKGVFAICDCCQEETTPEERTRFYGYMWVDWIFKGMETNPESWRKLERAVLLEDEDNKAV